MIYYINGMQGLFDRFFIDWYWGGKTKAWIIEGTEDLRPHIHTNIKFEKWLSTLVGFPLMSALFARVSTLDVHKKWIKSQKIQ